MKSAEINMNENPRGFWLIMKMEKIIISELGRKI